MWAALGSVTSRLPQACANAAARAGVTKGSSVLATTMLGNGSLTNGIGLKLRTSSGVCTDESTSAGATSNAPFTGVLERIAHWAMSAQDKLWAASTGGLAHSPM